MTHVAFVLLGMFLYAVRTIAVKSAVIAGVAAWVGGWVVAEGFWSTVAAVFLPPWSWYLLAEAALLHWGVV